MNIRPQLRSATASCLLPALLAALCLAPSAQGYTPMPGAWHILNWQADDGLLDNDVKRVCQMPDGSLIIATRGGVVRYDGLHFRRLPDAWGAHRGPPVSTVASDAHYDAKTGALWLLSDRGLSLLREGQQPRAIPLPDGTPALQPAGMFSDRTGALWLGYRNGIIVRVGDDAAVVPALLLQPSQTFASRMIAADAEGRIWTVGTRELARWNGEAFEKMSDVPRQDWTLCRSGNGLWLASERNVYQFRKGTLVAVLSLPDAPGELRISHLFEDRRGTLWIVVYGEGLYRWEDRELKRVDVSNSDIAHLFEDREGSLWLSSYGGGLSRLRPRVFTLLDEPGSPRGLTANSLCFDTRGDVWAALQGGRLFARRDNRWAELVPGRDWPGPSARGVTADTAGNVWISTTRDQLVRFDGQSLSAETVPEIASNRIVRAMLCAPDGELWLSQRGHLIHGQPGAWRKIAMRSENDEIVSLAAGRDNVIWAVNRSGTLWKIRNDTLEPVPVPPPQPGDGPAELRTLLIAADGALWIGTTGHGLLRYKEGRCHWVNSDHGLPSDTIVQLSLDLQDRLWAGSPIGFIMVPLAELNAAADRAPGGPPLSCIVYAREEGLVNLQASTGYQPVNAIAPDGRLWFAMHGGISIADPALAASNPVAPDVGLEGVWLEGAALALPASHQLQMPPGAQNLQFLFSAPSFVAPSKVRLQHRLLGWDRKIQDTDPSRGATYSALPPGTYHLWARAANNDGVWSAGATLASFTIPPHYWQTNWFKTLVVLLIVLATAVVVTRILRVRHRRHAAVLERKAAIEAERTRIARDMHDQLGATLNHIAIVSDLGCAAPERATEHLQNLAGSAREALSSLDEIVWAVDPRHDTLESLLDYVIHQISDQLKVTGIRCRLSFPDWVPHRYLPAEFRHHFSLCIREAVTNTIKHARATRVQLSLAIHGQHLRAEIADDGVGISDCDPSGHGLDNMRQRARAMNGRCDIERAPEGGTLVRIEAPLPAPLSV